MSFKRRVVQQSANTIFLMQHDVKASVPFWGAQEPNQMIIEP